MREPRGVHQQADLGPLDALPEGLGADVAHEDRVLAVAVAPRKGGSRAAERRGGAAHENAGCAGGGEALGDGEPDPARGAGDERGLVGEGAVDGLWSWCWGWCGRACVAS